MGMIKEWRKRRRRISMCFVTMGGEFCLVLGYPRVQGMCGFGESGPCLNSGITALLHRWSGVLVAELFACMSGCLCVYVPQDTYCTG
jgi:hypothetical protein